VQPAPRVNGILSPRSLSIGLGVALLAFLPARAENLDFRGTWEVTLSKLGASQSWRLMVSEDGGVYDAVIGSWKFSGRFENGALRLSCRSEPTCGVLALHTVGTSITGEGTIDSAPVTLRGKRPTLRPYAAPRTFRFEPQDYSGVFSGSVRPAIRIFSGDGVQTKTIDAEGFDEHGAKVSGFINPQTGPFYIENAMPGDTLAIHFTRIRTNRATADMYGDVIAPNALDPYYVRDEEKAREGGGRWTLEPGREVAVLAQPTERLGRFEVALRPMLGCVGVAPPAGQAIRTVNLGAYGGNLDYSGVHEGATLYLPVFQPGALLFIGDGHARQGDGELTGTGLETSMDVEFTVELIEGQSLGQPRIEDDQFVMISGIGGSLSDAMQLATTGMVRWLKETYSLNPAEIAMILGSSAHYDIAEIVDPQIHVVAKLRKDVLSSIVVRPKGDSTTQ
jgi:amidase